MIVIDIRKLVLQITKFKLKSYKIKRWVSLWIFLIYMVGYCLAPALWAFLSCWSASFSLADLEAKSSARHTWSKISVMSISKPQVKKSRKEVIQIQEMDSTPRIWATSNGTSLTMDKEPIWTLYNGLQAA